MTRDETEVLLSEKVKACVARRALPPGFSQRLQTALARRRRVFRWRMAAVLALCAILGGAVLGVSCTPRRNAPRQARLVAADAPRTEQAGALAFLGMVRECIRRVRGPRRKEEE